MFSYDASLVVVRHALSCVDIIVAYRVQELLKENLEGFGSTCDVHILSLLERKQHFC